MIKVIADLQYSSTGIRITVSKGGKKSEKEVVCNVNIFTEVTTLKAGHIPYFHLQIRPSAEVYQNMEQQYFIEDVAVETFLQSLALYNT